MRSPDRQGSTPIVVEEKRQQRTSLILRDVEYLVFADMVLREYVTNHLAKYLSQFERRVEKGRCYMTPYLGGKRNSRLGLKNRLVTKTPISENRNIGTMLFDLVFKEDPARKEVEFLKRDRDGKVRCAWGHAEALFFDATLEDGILKVPREKYAEATNWRESMLRTLVETSRNLASSGAMIHPGYKEFSKSNPIDWVLHIGPDGRLMSRPEKVEIRKA